MKNKEEEKRVKKSVEVCVCVVWEEREEKRNELQRE